MGRGGGGGGGISRGYYFSDVLVDGVVFFPLQSVLAVPFLARSKRMNVSKVVSKTSGELSGEIGYGVCKGLELCQQINVRYDGAD